MCKYDETPYNKEEITEEIMKECDNMFAFMCDTMGLPNDSRPKYKMVPNKLKVKSAEIVVHGNRDKPYFEIRYVLADTGQCKTGFSSFNLDFVFSWLEECFEVVGNGTKSKDEMKFEESWKP